MTHNSHVLDGYNKDIGLMSKDEAKAYYLNLCGNWVDPNPAPLVVNHDGVRVVRDDVITGTKVRGADCLISKLDESIDTLVYVQPRFGLAGVSILDVAKKYNKKVKLFMPSSKEISYHQACCIERGAEVEFHRIAAMPNLNLIAKKWADENKNAFFIPLGLKHELVTAGLVKVASAIPEPEEVWTVVSTGVLHRALQIAWPNAKFHAVAVARNMSAGEIGHKDIISHPLPFTTAIKDDIPPFPSVLEYDAKAWKYVPKNSGRDILFWNVGQNPKLINENLYNTVNSYRDWS